MGMGHQDFKTVCGRHCCDEGLCWHRGEWLRSPSPACHSPEPCGEAPLSPRPPFRGKPEIPHLECCWDAARPWQQFCFSALVPTVGPHSAADRISRVSMDIHAGFHRAGSPSAVLIPPASLESILYGKAWPTRCPHPPSFGGCSSTVGPALPASSTLECGVSIKAFKEEKRLISTSLPLGVGALIAHERKIKRNYSSGDTSREIPESDVSHFDVGIPETE